MLVEGGREASKRVWFAEQWAGDAAAGGGALLSPLAPATLPCMIDYVGTAGGRAAVSDARLGARAGRWQPGLLSLWVGSTQLHRLCIFLEPSSTQLPRTQHQTIPLVETQPNYTGCWAGF